MAQLTYAQYDRLERAVVRGDRIAVYRRGTEYIVVPLSLRTRDGREVIDSRNPTTGDRLELYIDEIESIEVVA
jgi:phage repressor protein C with HTH and peptisase S24 domain